VYASTGQAWFRRQSPRGLIILSLGREREIARLTSIGLGLLAGPLQAHLKFGTGLEKHDWMKIINGHAKDLYGDASPQSFTKAITESETGRTLFKALKSAPGREVEAAQA